MEGEKLKGTSKNPKHKFFSTMNVFPLKASL